MKIEIANFDDYKDKAEQAGVSGENLYNEEELEETLKYEIETEDDITEENFNISFRSDYGIYYFACQRTEEGNIHAVFSMVETPDTEILLNGYDELVQAWKEQSLPEDRIPGEQEVKEQLFLAINDYHYAKGREASYLDCITCEDGSKYLIHICFQDENMEDMTKRFTFVKILVLSEEKPKKKFWKRKK